MAVVVVLAIVALSCSGGDRERVAEGVGNVSADALAERGIYLGLPGKLPAGILKCPALTPATTTGDGTTVPSAPHVGAEQQAVHGDPADGRATVSSRSALAAALAKTGGFVGTVNTGTAVLVQFKDIYAYVVATAWAVPLTGMAQLSCGPAPTDTGTTASCQPRPNTAIIFVDAVTGQFITEVGFSGNSS